MAVPHPAVTRESLLRAEHVRRSFHWFFFQLPQLPERALRADNYAFVDWLWDCWTAPGFTDEEHLAEVKRMLAVPGALEATLGYYRAMFDPARADPDLAEVRQAAGRPIVVPTLALCGAGDKRAEVMQDQARHFAGPYRFELVPGSSHFLQREQPQAVTRLSWTGSPGPSRYRHAELTVPGWHARTRTSAHRRGLLQSGRQAQRSEDRENVSGADRRQGHSARWAGTRGPGIGR
jgi:hypothetical protein